MSEVKIKEAISNVIDKEDCFTFFWENFNDNIDAVVTELEKKKLKYLTISTEAYMEETFKYMESIKTSGITSRWEFRDKIRSPEVDVLLVYGYEAIGLNQEIFEIMVRHDIDSREDFLTKTIVATKGRFDSVISEKLRYKLNTRALISCKE